MPGMGGSPIQLTNPLLVAIFRHALFATSVAWILGLGLVVLLVSTAMRRVYSYNLSEGGLAEPRSRTYLRWSFGALWILDGILQFQPSMPLGLANDVVAPASVGSPSWLHAIVFDGIGIWNSHPVALAVGTAWIQVGIGLLLLVSNGGAGRLAVAVAVAVGWTSMIWLVGNAAGGLFSPTSSILFGWPGAPLFYVAAGAWLVVGNRRFTAHFARLTSRGLSVVLVVGAVVQSRPGREFWHGGNSNALTTMTGLMTKTPQPQWLSWLATRGGSLAGTMGGGFNLLVVFWLIACATGLWWSTVRPLRWPVRLLIGGCAVLWLVAQDAAVFGGLAADLNSLVPLALLAWCAVPSARSATPRERRLPREMRSSTGAVAASFAARAVFFSVFSMGWASVASAENTCFLAQNGPASAVAGPAAGFSLVNQAGRPYHLGEHRGHYTLLTFLDPVCWTDCPLLASQLKSVRAALSVNAPLDIVVVAADPYHESFADVRHFIQRRALGAIKDFYFVTNHHVKVVEKVWSAYSISVVAKRTDKMSIYSDYVFIVDPRGQLMGVIPDNPLGNWSGQRSAVSELLSLVH